MRLSKRKHKVRMHIENGPSIEGILLGRSRSDYLLRAATIVKDEEASYSVDGEVRVPVRRVLFYQVLTEVSA